MAMFKSDAQGFLIGEVIKSSHVMLKAQEQGLMIWRAIRADVKEIARAVGTQTATSARLNQPGARGPYGLRPAVAPAGRSGGAGGRTQAPAARVSSPAGRSSTSTVASPLQRAANGRFVAGQKRGGAGGGVPDIPGASGGAGMGGAMNRLGDTISRLSASLNASDNVDPTINAAKEITDVVGPLGRGLFSLFGRNAERKKERWYNRFLKALTSPIGGKAGPAGASGGGGGLLSGAFGGFGAMLKGVPAMLMGLFTRILLPIAALWGSFELGQWVGKKIYEWLDSSGIMTKVFDAFDSIRDTAMGAWDSVTNGIEGAWKTATDAFTGAVASFMSFPEKISGILSGIDSALRNIPVIGKAADTVKEVATQAGAGFKEARGGDVSTVAAPVGPVAQAARAAGGMAGTAAGWALGQTSKVFESGKGGAGTVSTGKGDNGGASYGTYQLSSKMGTLQKFLAQSPYGDQFAGLAPGSPEFNAKWKEIAKNDPTFGGAQHDFIKRTHYDPMVAGLKKDGIDISGRGAGVKDAVWSTSVQFGGDSKLIQRALNGKDASKMSDAEFISKTQDYKVANNDSLFRKSSANVRAGTLARAESEKNALLKVDAGGLQPTYRHGTTMAAVPNIPSLVQAGVPSAAPATIPPLPDLPAMPTRLNSVAGGRRDTMSITMREQTGQNVGDRAIAHIVTGGMGST
jgi:hypothetical protein